MAFKVNDDFGNWLAGFADGEGSFLISKSSRGVFCSFRIALHHADEPILREIAGRTGLGRVIVQFSPSQAAPRAMWTVCRKMPTRSRHSAFEQFPLRAKKRRDFEIWARAVREWDRLQVRGNQYSGMERIDYSAMNALRHELRAGRPNRGPKVVLA